MSPLALRAIADAADALARLARAALDEADADPNEYLTLDEARAIGKYETTRPIVDARRAGELTIYGRQRSQRVKRGEFMAWLETRRSTPIKGPDNPRIAARFKRIEREADARRVRQ